MTRYSTDEAERILGRAAVMSALDEKADGVSSDMLRQVAEEAGIAPDAIDRALREAELRGSASTSRLDTGLQTSVHVDVDFDDDLAAAFHAAAPAATRYGYGKIVASDDRLVFQSMNVDLIKVLRRERGVDVVVHTPRPLGLSFSVLAACIGAGFAASAVLGWATPVAVALSVLLMVPSHFAVNAIDKRRLAQTHRQVIDRLLPALAPGPQLPTAPTSKLLPSSLSDEG